MEEKPEYDKVDEKPILMSYFIALCWAVFFFLFYLIIMLYGGCSNPSSEWRLAEDRSEVIPTLAKGETDV